MVLHIRVQGLKLCQLDEMGNEESERASYGQSLCNRETQGYSLSRACA